MNEHSTNGHLDNSRVHADATLICPVKVPGGSVYLGDVNAMQGDCEIAGHTAEVENSLLLSKPAQFEAAPKLLNDLNMT
ncbi:acetamidase/formamidase family protein [Paenibacillus glycanilyticus]|uniref:acetamidase/formamidase family protein n=1 Tax=Paenibacillus glycanilyticus TaxID=126569 RepID=UPI0035A22B25